MIQYTNSITLQYSTVQYSAFKTATKHRNFLKINVAHSSKRCVHSHIEHPETASAYAHKGRGQAKQKVCNKSKKTVLNPK